MNRNRRRGSAFCLTVVFLISGVLLLTGCKSSQGEDAEKKNGISESVKLIQNGIESFLEVENNLLPKMRTVLNAVETAYQQDAYEISCDIVLNVDGTLLNGEYDGNLDAQVSHDQAGNLQMTSVFTTDLTEIRSTYKDGIYTVDNGEQVTEEEKSQETVLEGVTQIERLVKNAAADVDHVDTEESENGTIYTFSIPNQLAETYLEEAVEDQDNEIFSGMTFEVESNEIEAVLDQNGEITDCNVFINGTVHKLVFTVPVQATIKTTIISE